MNGEDFLKKIGAIKRGHFLLTSGFHSDVYFEKFRILENPEVTGILIREKLNEIKRLEPELIAGPTLGGVIVAYELARQLKIKAIYVERGEGRRCIKRDFSIRGNEKVVVADDVLTTGGSINESIEALKTLGLNPVGVFVLIDRSGGLNFGIPLISTIRVRANIYNPSDCPLCTRGIPLEKPGGNPTL